MKKSLLLLVAFAFVACGGDKTVASKSQQAYLDAKAKGVEVGGGHGGHGGAAASPAVDHAAMGHGEGTTDHSTMDHGTHGGAAGTAHTAHGGAAAADDSKMDHSSGAMDHSKMGHAPAGGAHAASGHGAGHSAHATHQGSGSTQHAAHGRSPQAQHSASAHGGHNASQHAGHAPSAHGGHRTSQPAAHTAEHQSHSATQHAGHESTQHQQQGHAQHSATAQHPAHGTDPHAAHTAASAQHGGHAAHGSGAIPPGGLWGPLPGSVMAAAPDAPMQLEQRTVTLGTAPAPRSSREMEQVDPAMTLRQDRVDLAAPISIHEAAKDSQAGGHAGYGTTAPATHQHPGSADPHAAHQTQGTNHPAPQTETLYVCPMHPDVTSAAPGRCPKCGMALVKKEK